MRKGQVSTFVIVAIVIVVGIVLYFVIRGGIGSEKIPADLIPVFDYYQSCIESETRTAIQLAGARGGRINVGEYIPGSEYAPFSSQLNFMETPVPYWFYISGNGLVRENVPTKEQMESEISDYVKEGIGFCELDNFFGEGYKIERGEPEVSVDIGETIVKVDVESVLSVSRGENSARRTNQHIEIDSKLGKFYDLASEIYLKQKSEAFLERYALDVLYLYTPVDGVEIQCGPKIWLTRNVVDNLKEGLEVNIPEIKFGGNYYKLKNESNKYFVLDKNVDEAVNLLYSKNWPTKVEIEGEGVDEDVMIAETIGTQEGLGAMGFCYAPYHFVYDVSFPVMIQVYNTEEFFQFPVVVVIDNNVARQAQLSEGFGQQEDFDLCQFKEKAVEVNLYDVNLNSVDGNLSYECFDKRCRLGETKDGRFRGVAPACVNGFVQVKANGFADKKQLMSTNRESFADIILDREYEVEIELQLGGSELRDTAVISFTKDDGKSTSAVLPEFKEVKLSEGNYEVRVYIYGNSSITIPASTKYQCVEVPEQGLLGFFGSTEEKCFDITVPATKVEYALIGGGKTNSYLLETELKKGKLIVKVESLLRPTSLEQLQQNFELFDTRRVDLTFNDN